MTHDEFLKMVADMRAAQKMYFRTRAKDPVRARAVLEESKRLERAVDDEIQRQRLSDAGIGEQGKIFG